MDRGLFKKRSVQWALIWFLALLFIGITAPFFLSQQASAMNFGHILEAPSFVHWFGTDSLGRDLFARVLCGSRVSLGVSFLAVGIALLIGVTIGACSGYFGGWMDKLLMGLVDIFLCFPIFFLMLAVIAILGPGIFHIFLIIGLTGWMGTARLVRAEILSLKEREFVLASRALGAGDGWILFRHLVPNALGPVVVNAILGLSSAILVEGALSFLGVGVQPPTPSWGNILMDGKSTLGVAWWLTFFPGAMIFLTILSGNVLGQALQSMRGEP